MANENKYIFQLRRGVRYVDATGATLLDGEKPIRNDWEAYTAQENHLNPLDGELVVEFEQVYDPTTKIVSKTTPRFKIGFGNQSFADLDYISPDSFVLPTQATITVDPTKWMSVDIDGDMIDEDGKIFGADEVEKTDKTYEFKEGVIVDPDNKIIKNTYVQFVRVNNALITPNSKVDIQPSPSDLVVFREKDITFVAINANTHVRVCVVGQKPTKQYTFNVTVTEVV